MRIACVSAVVVTGCFSPTPQPGLPCSADDDCPSGLTCNADDRCVEPGTPDPDAAIDAAAIDGDPPPDACSPCPPVTVATYRFENDLSDANGEHDGTEVGTTLVFVPGRPGAGQTLHIPSSGASWMLIPDSPAFDIAAGSVEMWFRIGPQAPPNVYLGLISRDAGGSATDGHFSVRVGHDRRVVARIQRTSDPTVQAFRCTAAAIADTGWHHLEVDFGGGGFAMAVDGAPATGATWTSVEGDTFSCTETWNLGIAGNDNPWIVGGLSVTSIEGTGSPVTNVAADVDIDDLIIWTM